MADLTCAFECASTTRTNTRTRSIALRRCAADSSLSLDGADNGSQRSFFKALA